MSDDDIYRPTDEDRKLFHRIFAVARRHPDLLVAAGAQLDIEYSSQALRDRKADTLRAHRANPNHNRYSRSFQRKHCDSKQLSKKLGFSVSPTEAVPPPQPRVKGTDGKPQRPEMSLIDRFWQAWHDIMEDDTDLYVLTAERRWSQASRRVLMAWLRLDPDRADVERLTEFQELRTVPTDDGPGAFGWAADFEPRSVGAALLIRRDGSLDGEAAKWVEKAREALELLGESQHAESDVTEREPPINHQVSGECIEADEQQPPALTKTERLTLAALAGFDPSRLALTGDVCEAMPVAERLSERTTRDVLKKLLELELAERPEGDKQGARLTIKGRRLASKLAD